MAIIFGPTTSFGEAVRNTFIILLGVSNSLFGTQILRIQMQK